MSVNLVNKDTGELTLLAGATMYADNPIGTILPYGGATAPTGWFLCQGQAISRTEYADLFAVIGTAYGSGNGSTTFNVPDLREATTKGVGLSGKSDNHYDTDGVALGEFVEDRIQSHLHSAYTGNKNGWIQFAEATSSGVAIRSQDFDYNNAFSVGEVANARNGNTTEVKAVGVNYIIKAKMIAVPADFVQSMSEFEKYSTNEVLTNKTWMDGKPIYRKIVEKNLTFIGNSWNNTDVDVSDIDTLCNCVLLSHKFACTGFYTKKASNQLQLYCVSDANWSAHAIILEYTKTTNG